MHTNLLLENLLQGTLQEIGKLGLCYELNCQYRRTYARLKIFAEKRNIDSYSSAFIRSFLENIEQKYIAGAIGSSRRNHLRPAILGESQQ